MRHPLALTALSATFFVLAFPPYGVWPLAFVCLVPWILALPRWKSGRQAFLSGIALSTLITVTGYFWVGTTLEHFGNLPAPVAMLGCVLFGLFNQIQFAFWGQFFWARPATPFWKLCAVYGALDWAIPKLFMDSLGLSLVNALPLAQWAEHVSMYGLTTLIVWGNLVIARAIATRSWKSTRAFAGVTLALAVLGFVRMQGVRSAEQSSPPARLAVIQANIGDLEKVASETGYGEAPNVVVGRYLRMTEQAGGRPEVQAALWPETAYPSTFLKPFSLAEQRRSDSIVELSKRLGLPIWLGGYDRDGAKDYNAVFFLDPARDVSREFPKVYRKSVLLPFAEYIPGAESIGWIRRMFPQVGFFGRGNGPQGFDLRLRPSAGAGGGAVPAGAATLRAMPLICYEALFGWFARAGRHDGAQAILNFTNDSWFGPWGEPQLHHALSQMRSIESRLPQLRATNTGISSVISATGAILARGPIGTPEVLVFDLPTARVDSGLYVWLGEWWGWMLLMAGAAVLVRGRGRPRHSRR